MVTVHVGPEEIGPFDLGGIPTADINRAITRRTESGAEPCVKVHFEESGLSGWGVQTQTCAGGEDGGTPTGQQEAILDLWPERVTSKSHLSPGQVTSFLKQVPNLL